MSFGSPFLLVEIPVFLTVLSLIGLVIGHLRKSLIIVPSIIGTALFGIISVAAFDMVSENERFLTKKAVLAQVYQRDFDRVCSQSGRVIPPETTIKNCYEIDGYRVWAIGNRFYVGVLNNDALSIDVIFDLDELVADKQRSIVHVAPDFDFNHLGAALNMS